MVRRSYKHKKFSGRGGRRKTFARTGMGARKAAFTALRKVNKIQRRIERKTRVTLDTGALYINNLGGTYNMRSACVGVASGDGRDNRDGNKISPSVLHFHGDVTWNGLGGNDQWLRVIVVQDRDTIEGVGPVLYTPDKNVDIIESNGFLSEFNIQTKNRYKVLYNKHFKFNTSKDIGEAIYFTRRIKLPSVVEFNGTAVGDVSKNNCWVFAWGSSSAATNPITFRFYSRMYYTDL